MAHNDPMFRLRIPQPLKDRLAEEAARNKRSLNAELLARVEESLMLGGAATPRVVMDMAQAKRNYRARQRQNFPGVADSDDAVLDLALARACRLLSAEEKQALLVLLQRTAASRTATD